MLHVDEGFKFQGWQFYSILNDLLIVVVDHMQDDTVVSSVFVVFVFVPVGSVDVNFYCAVKLEFFQSDTGFGEIWSTERLIVLSGKLYGEWRSVGEQ